jgi:alpha-1,3-mannosyl-glycoprotein beta-1,2-N-acetylglucosaminyltransferase
MRSTIIKKIIITTGVFFLMNILLLFSMKARQKPTDNHEEQGVRQPNERNASPVISRSVSVSSLPKVDVLLPIVVFACNRPRALQSHIEALLKIRKNAELNPIIVSLDCHDHATMQIAKNFSDKIKTIIELPDLGPLNVSAKDRGMAGYYRIARHYGYSLNHVINVLNYEAIIVTEDDLDVSPDFLDYFQALYPLLKYDKTIWCISAWNDNGIDQKIDRVANLLHRSDFFPGLGWLLTKTVWNEIKDNWPQGFWDDWMRKPEQRRDRACIRPEVSRTAISPEGKRGVSGGQFYEGYLKKILKNTDPIDWKTIDVSYLIKDRYDPVFQARVDSCPVITVSDLAQLKSDMNCAQLRYSTDKEFTTIANTLRIMSDFKSKVPRTAYRGVVQCRYGKTRIYVTPNQKPWKNYR